MTNQTDLFKNERDIEFLLYHKENPEIYEAFKKKALEAARKGFKHYGSKGIFELIRWETGVSGSDGFKVNNKYTPNYARLFEKDNPYLKGFFRKRVLKQNQ